MEDAILNYLITLKIVNLRLSILLKEKTEREAEIEVREFCQELLEMQKRSSSY